MKWIEWIVTWWNQTDWIWLQLSGKGESESRGSHLNSNPRTNKHTDCIYQISVLLPMTIIWQRYFPNSKSSLEQPKNNIQYFCSVLYSTRGLSKSFQKSVSQLFMQLWLPSCCDGIQHNFSPLNSKSIEGSVPSEVRGRSQTTLTKFCPLLTTYLPLFTLVDVWTTTYIPTTIPVNIDMW